MGQRRRARELALQILFQAEVTRDRPRDILSRFWADRPVPEAVRRFAEALALGVLEFQREIDDRIAAATEHWRLERMATVDRNVLRMAVYELTCGVGTPPAVIIDEAIEVAKKYGSDESGPFINGVLDRVRRGVEKPGDAT